MTALSQTEPTQTLFDGPSLRSLIAGFEDGSLPRASWDHRAHLAVAAWYVSNHNRTEAIRRFVDGICAYNLANGIRQTRTSGYHHTITMFWLTFIQGLLKGFKGTSLEAVNMVLVVLGCRPNLILEYFSRGVLSSWQARMNWVEPDLTHFPFVKATA